MGSITSPYGFAYKHKHTHMQNGIMWTESFVNKRIAVVTDGKHYQVQMIHTKLCQTQTPLHSWLLLYASFQQHTY